MLRALDAELDDTVPAHREITLEDLLSFRLGFGSVMAPPGSYPIQRAEAALDLHSIGGPPWPPVAHDPDTWMAALGSLPLMYQPGERWLYNTSAQVLGVLLARAGGRDLESVLRERILDPLGMADTGFTVPAEQLGRLTTAYRPDPETGQLEVLDEPADSWWSKSHLVPGRKRLAGVHHRRLLVVRLDAAGRRLRPGRAGARAGDGRADDDGPPDPEPAAGLGTVPGRARRLGPGPGGAGRRCRPPGASMRDRLDRRQRHRLAIEHRSGVTGILFGQRGLTSPVPEPLAVDFWAGVNAASAAA